MKSILFLSLLVFEPVEAAIVRCTVNPLSTAECPFGQKTCLAIGGWCGPCDAPPVTTCLPDPRRPPQFSQELEGEESSVDPEVP